jgi:hypothetical protein
MAAQRRARLGTRSRLRVLQLLFLGAVLLLAVLSFLRTLFPREKNEATTCPSVVKARAGLDWAAAREWDRRSELYDSMVRDMMRDGITLVSRAGGTRGLVPGSLFDRDPVAKQLVPRLRHLSVPVRAIVIPLLGAHAAASMVERTTRAALLPVLSSLGVWLQDAGAYHMSLFHTSHHMDPVAATPAEVDAEALVVGGILKKTCAMQAVLQRVLVTPGGVIMAVWNVVEGGQPATMRAALRAALTAAPSQLVSDAPILHMTLARVVALPEAGAAPLLAAVQSMSAMLCGTQVQFDAVWFAEERHALALALRGDYSVRPQPL